MRSEVPQNDRKRTQDDAKRAQETSRCAKTRPEATQNDPKRSLRVIKKNPNCKTKKGSNQDDPKTVLDRPRADLPTMVALLGSHLGGQNGTKTDPKTIQNRSEKSRGEKTDPRRSWTRLEAILGRLGCHLGALETLWHYARRCFVKIHFFDVKTVRRRS